MMEVAVTPELREWLNRKGMSAGLGATSNVHGIKGPGAAMERARRQVLADAVRGDEPHRPTTRREVRVDLGNSGEKGATAKPRQFTGGGQNRGEKPLCKIQNNLNEPSPARGRPVLQLLQGGSSKRSATTNVTLRLVLN